MISLLSSVGNIFGYIILGFFLNKINIIPYLLSKIFIFISFNILLPIALITNFWQISFPNIIFYQLILAFFGAGIIVFIIGFCISKKIYKFDTDDSALFGLGACFGNSVALGIPLMYSILGPSKAMPYMVLVLFHGIIHFTYTTLIIEGYRNRKHSIFKIFIKILLGLFSNIILISMLIGIALNYFNIIFPYELKIFLIPISKLALPAILLSLGFTLSKFKINNDILPSIILTCLKNIIHPIIAFIIAKYIFSMSNLLIFIITIAAALPSGSQTYYFSYRYNSLQKIISANILLSTFFSFFTLSFLIFIFDY